MTYRFRSKAWGDVVMLQADGDRLLSAMGVARASRGIVTPDDMAAVLQALDEAIARDEAKAADPQAAGDEVTLRQRAWPLIEMLKAAAAQREAVVWGV